MIDLAVLCELALELLDLWAHDVFTMIKYAGDLGIEFLANGILLPGKIDKSDHGDGFLSLVMMHPRIIIGGSDRTQRVSLVSIRAECRSDLHRAE